jgi:osmotically-inducible protein OsmY
MSEYREKQSIVRAEPLAGRPVVETQYDSVVRDRGMSGGAIAALVVAGIAAAAVITMLVINGQQRSSDEALMRERAQAAANQQAPVQSPQQPVIVNVPPNQTAVPAQAPVQSAPAAVAPSSAEVELDVTSKLMDDPDLRSYPIDVKVSGGTATLSGHLPSEVLKMRAERLARTVKGVRSVVNNTTVQS